MDVTSRSTTRVAVLVAALAAAALAMLLPGTAAAAPPPNDEPDAAIPLGAPPALATGTTRGATLGDLDPQFACSDRLGAAVWYRLDRPGAGPLVVRLRGGGALEGVLAVYVRQGTRLVPAGCDRINERGLATVFFRSGRNASYLVLVGQRERSPRGDFQLRALRPEPEEKAPGTPLPARGVVGTVDPALDPHDLYAVRMAAGTSYRLSFSSKRCAEATLRRTLDTPPVLRLESCSDYVLFTPGPDGGGVYTIDVEASVYADGELPYRLLVRPAAGDDTAPAVALRHGIVRPGSLSPRGIDVVDLYRFAVPVRSDVNLRLRGKAAASFRLVVRTDLGRRVGSAVNGLVRRRLAPGRYYASVSAAPGTPGGRYTLRLLVRSLTTTAVLASGVHGLQIAPGRTVQLEARVAPAQPGGVVELQIDRLDPIAGWQFSTLFRTRVGANGVARQTWRPPTLGRWRVRARYLGGFHASPSRSRYASVLVAEPLR